MNHEGRARPGSAPPIREVTDAEVERHRGLVGMVLAKLYRKSQLDHSLEHEDLVQVGMWAVWEALRRWNPEKGAQSTYITSYIWGYVMRYQRDTVRATGYTRVRKNDKGETIGGRLAHVISLDAPDENGFTLLDHLASEPVLDLPDPVAAVARLPTRLRLVGEGMLDDHTLEQDAQVLDLSRERVRQLRLQVKNRLRDELVA